MKVPLRRFVFLLLLFSIGFPAYAQKGNCFMVRRFVDKAGREIGVMETPVKPPKRKMKAVPLPKSNPKQGIVTLEVPAFDWVYGCAATSAGMIAGYYDRNGYDDIYTGSTNSGVCPLDNSVWGQTTYTGVTCGECPFVATHEGLESRSDRGHVDDYWYDYGSSLDPYYGQWTAHERDCLADFMATNQYNDFWNTDGSTRFYFSLDGSKYRAVNEGDGNYGIKLFLESRGYEVEDYYYQLIKEQSTDGLNGATFADYKAEIDAGRPVMITVEGHAMVGVGYDDSTETVYLHDTWDYDTHSMTWGGSYYNMKHIGICVYQLKAVTASTPEAVLIYRQVKHYLLEYYGGVMAIAEGSFVIVEINSDGSYGGVKKIVFRRNRDDMYIKDTPVFEYENADSQVVAKGYGSDCGYLMMGERKAFDIGFGKDNQYEIALQLKGTACEYKSPKDWQTSLRAGISQRLDSKLTRQCNEEGNTDLDKAIEFINAYVKDKYGLEPTVVKEQGRRAER